MGEIKLLSTGIPDLCPMLDRSPGMHVSTIINDLCTSMGHYESNNASYDDQPIGVKNRMAVGNAFEFALIEMYERARPGEHIQPGEQEMDGIFGTPDLLHAPTNTLHEIKCTWLSSKHPPDGDKFWKYWVQLKAYCHMMGITTGVLNVLHVQGDYSHSGPVYSEWTQTFSEQELLENWYMLKSRGEILR